jgi:hypothetical protein
MARITYIADCRTGQRTNAMRDVFAQAAKDVMDADGLLAQLIARRDAAYEAANISLPLTNEDGQQVVHGARKMASSLADMYQLMITTMGRIVDDVWTDEMRGR